VYKILVYMNYVFQQMLEPIVDQK